MLYRSKTAKIFVFGVEKGQENEKKLQGGVIQTFFPANWSQDKILAECASALINPQRGLAVGKQRLWEAVSDSGLTIGWFFDPTDPNRISTFFPKL